MTRTTTRVATAAGAAMALVLLSGCGGGGGDSSSGSSAAGGAQSRAGVSAPGLADGGAADGEKSTAGDPGSGGRTDAAAPLVTDQRVVRDASMTVRAKDVTAAATRVRDAAETAKGFVSDEKTSSTPPDGGGGEPRPADGSTRSSAYTQSVLTLRVPSAALDRVMTQVGQTGTVLSRSQSSEDVTTTYVDVRSRVASQTASVERVRALLVRASTLGQIVQVEGELSRREADLESLQAQLKSLEDRTALSTLTVELTPTAVPVRPTTQQDDGFLGGLRHGWTALLATLTVLLTVVGALLPFAVVAAAVGIPAYRWYRRSRRARVTSPPAGPQPAPAP